MKEVTILLTEADYRRLLAIKRRQGANIAIADFTELLLIRELHRLHPEFPDYDED